METMWFYFAQGQRLGPVTLEELVRALGVAPEPHRALVWREGLADWREAGSVAELSGRLPPPLTMALPPGGYPPESVPFEDAEKLARFYRRLVLLIGIQLLVGFLLVPAQVGPSPGPLAGLANIVLLLVIALTVLTAYKLAQILRSGPPLLWAIAMLIPCINIISLLALSTKAQTWCRRYGIKVGLLGPTKESIEEVRRLAMTRHFE